MEYLIYNAKVQEKVERLILLLFSLYNITILIVTIRNRWAAWAAVLMATGLLISWGTYLFQVKSYRTRAFIVSVTTHFTAILYACRVPNLFPVLAVILTLAIIMALYGITELMSVSVLTTMILFFYHGVIIHTIQWETLFQTDSSLMQVFNVFFAEYIIYFWVKKRNESTMQLYKLIEALQDAERSKDDFLSNISHEIRTPVNTICGMSELVQGQDDPKKIKDALFDIQVAGRNLLTTISDVLDFSELQSGKIEIEAEEYNITSTINDVINMTMAKKSQKNLELIVDCDASIPCGLLGDEKKIRRVIMNLVNNAIKFTNEGCVTIVIGCRRESYGINLIVTVKDTGIGMNEESQEKLFTSFNQVDTKRNRQEGGIGLGLAIAQALVEKMGGVITVRSKWGKGTVARFVVPQKIIDERPIAHLERTEELNLATYIDMEQFNMMPIRDAYSGNIMHMVKQMQVKCHNCRNLSELKRRTKREQFTHIFISIVEYLEEPKYFDELSKQIIVIVILDREDDKKLTNPEMVRLYKPFYILPIVQILNRGKEIRSNLLMSHQRKFIAPGVKVLVVDDNLMNIRVVEGLLERYQITVKRALSGQEALKMIELKEFDFVFMDHMMPEMDGIEALHRIREKEGSYYQEVPIIALTANAIAGSREKFIAEGFNDFVEKPVETSVLERVLRRTISETKIQYISEEQMEKEQKTADTFAVGDLDVEKGMLYCGGKEKYLQILAESYATSVGTREQIEQWYRNEDWKNYTIGVHAVKSTMLSIGAVPLSGQAKELEMAGKRGDIAFIKENHNKLIAEQRRVMEMIGKDPLVPVGDVIEKMKTNKPSKSTNSDGSTKEEVSETVLNQLMEELENAAFDLDADEMMEIVHEMQRYQYAGISLEEALAPVIHKVEMSDLMSAYDMVSELRAQWKEQKKGGNR